LGRGEAGRGRTKPETTKQNLASRCFAPERHLIGFESDEAIVQKLQERLRGMTDAQLILFGKQFAG